MNTTENKNSKTGATSKKRKYVLVGLGILATSLLTFFGIQYWKKNKQTTSDDPDSPNFKATNPNQSGTTSVKTKQPSHPKQPSQSKQPIKKSEGDTKKSSSSSSTNTLKDFKKKITLDIKSKLTPTLLAKGLQIAYLKLDFLKAYTYLKRIQTVEQYITVSKIFSLLLIGRGRKTLVTALLDVFKTENQRQLLFTEFKRIGLKQKGNQWALGELEETSPLIITTQVTKVWKDPNTSVSVPINMVLGREVCKRGAFTLFENQQQYYLVESKSIKNSYKT